MDADLDTLCTVVYCTADDLLPEARPNARRRISDAELVTLCVAQAIMGIPSDRRFLAVARKRLAHLFPDLPRQAGYFKRRRRLADTIEWLLAHFAQQSPGYADDLLLCDSTPVPCAASRETVKRSALADAAGYGYCDISAQASLDCLRPPSWPEVFPIGGGVRRPRRVRPAPLCACASHMRSATAGYPQVTRGEGRRRQCTTQHAPGEARARRSRPARWRLPSCPLLRPCHESPHPGELPELKVRID